ncbi:HipA domain-containing protein [Intestinibacillus massiliensis]|uniref:HipA domain-containing protein n=1 Tax=Intestinibacillus massiliensis TaxID=1871029 RepID=UPI001F364816|nr:HipA domain-containing protein [Intestinibacillus massiliensis]
MILLSHSVKLPELEISSGVPMVLSSTSKGDAMKWYLPQDNTFIKANRIDHGREYQDSVAEVIAARLAQEMGVPAVPYRLCRIKLEDGQSILGTLSPNFCTPEESYISFETMVESAAEPVYWGTSAKENYQLVIDWFRRLTNLDARTYLDTMLLFDYLICNEDRHLNNFGVLKDVKNGTYRFPPLFDNGYALGFMQTERRPVEQYLYSCKAKPFSTSFTKQLHLVNCLPTGITLPERIADKLFAGLPVGDSTISYCRGILDERLARLKEYFSWAM